MMDYYYPRFQIAQYRYRIKKKARMACLKKAPFCQWNMIENKHIITVPIVT